MIKISKHTKLGFLIIACLFILVWGINFLKGINLFKNKSEYYVVYDRIDGLIASSAISINGFKVGQVSNIQLLSDNSGRILVTLALQGKTKIPKGSTAQIISTDIMGTKSVNLLISKSFEFYKSQDTIPGETGGDLKDQILPLKKKAEKLIGSFDTIMVSFNNVLNQQTRENLKQTFTSLNHTMANLELVSADLNQILKSGKVNTIIDNLEGVTAKFNKNSGQIENIIKNFSSLSDSLSGLKINKLNTAIAGLNQVIQKLNSNQGSAGMLINDSQLYQNLVNLSNSLDVLIKDVRSNPRRYVHLSAIDMGKDYYIIPGTATANAKNDVIFKVLLTSSTSRLTTESDLFKGLGNIEEEKVHKMYNYLAGKASDFNEISILLKTAQTNFPDAIVVAFKNGKMIKLEKAINK
jgi:phospholipid/cholesterol/gamma-HCH transport system substrate-binding protein